VPCLSGIFFLLNTQAGATDYYIDFKNGSDAADGTSMSHPWQHSPGDPNATENSLQTVLSGGDVIRFRGDVIYRGSVIAKASGEPGKPIKYIGDSWGPNKATVDGMDKLLVSITKCTNDVRCSFVSYPEDTYIANLPLQIKLDAEIDVNGHEMVQSQYPVQPKAMWSKPATDFWPIKFSQMVQDSLGWTLLNATPLEILGDSQADDMRVLIWGLPNWIHVGEDVTYNNRNGAIHFSSKRFVPFTNRLGYYGLSNHPRFVKSAFSFATLSNGSALVFRFPGLDSDKIELEYSARDVAFDILGHSHLEFKGFNIQGFAGENDVATKGNAFRSRSGTPTDVLISANDILRLKTYGSAINFLGASDLRIDGNKIARIKEGFGISLLGSSRVKITNNSVDEVGLSGISIIKNQDVLLSNNMISHITSIHGNGISVYLTNKNISIENNIITHSTRPITFHGDKTGQPINISIVGNLIYASGEDSIPIQSWGNLARDIRIERNILISDIRRGIAINKNDRDVRIKQNITEDIFADSKLVQGLVVQDNILVGNSSFGNVDDGNALQPQLHSRIKSAFEKNDFSDPVICDTVATLMRKSGTAVTTSSPFIGMGPNHLCAP
jgi:Right handed beta helix region